MSEYCEDTAFFSESVRFFSVDCLGGWMNRQSDVFFLRLSEGGQPSLVLLEKEFDFYKILKA